MKKVISKEVDEEITRRNELFAKRKAYCEKYEQLAREHNQWAIVLPDEIFDEIIELWNHSLSSEWKAVRIPKEDAAFSINFVCYIKKSQVQEIK